MENLFELFIKNPEILEQLIDFDKLDNCKKAHVVHLCGKKIISATNIVAEKETRTPVKEAYQLFFYKEQFYRVQYAVKYGTPAATDTPQNGYCRLEEIVAISCVEVVLE